MLNSIRIKIALVLFTTFFMVANAFAFTPPPTNKKLVSLFNSLPSSTKDVSTRIRLLTSNEEAWYARWNIMENAKKSIVSTYFIIDNDIFGWSFLGLLRKKAHAGVSIKLMVDGRFLRMSKKLKDIDELEELAKYPNVQIKLYNPIKKALLPAFKDLRQILLSNHDKIIIVDSKICLTGGRNIGKDYFIQHGEFKNVFRDMDVVMEGQNVVKQLQRAFDEEWKCLRNMKVKPDRVNVVSRNASLDLAYRIMNRYLHGRGVYSSKNWEANKSMKKLLDKFNNEITKYTKLNNYSSFRLFRGERKKPVKILDRHSMLGPRKDIGVNLIKMIDACKSEILMQNPYVVLSPPAIAALERAGKRGVKIVLNTNSANSTNHLVTVAFFLNDWKMLLKRIPTMKIMVFPKGQNCLHTKAFVFDRQISIIGTYNLDPLSMVVNSEVVTVIKDKPFSVMTALRMEKLFAKCLEYKISVDSKGNIQTIYGPENHINKKIIKKMNIMRKLQWLKPLI